MAISFGIFPTFDSRQNEVKDKLLMIHSNIEKSYNFFLQEVFLFVSSHCNLWFNSPTLTPSRPFFKCAYVQYILFATFVISVADRAING